MPDAYDLPATRFVQQLVQTSAANDLNVPLGPVPRGRIWTILTAVIQPSVNETQVFWFAVQPSGGTFALPITWPTSLASVVASQLFPTFVREGMEFKLFPGERIYGMRGAATAGSTISLLIRFLDTAMPLYREYDLQRDRLMGKPLEHSTIIAPHGGLTRPSDGGLTIGRPTFPPKPK